MTYYILEYLVTNDDFFFEKEEFNFPKLNRLSHKGTSLKNEEVKIKYFDKYSQKKALDHLPSATVFTASTRFKDLCLEIEPDYLEVFPVELVSKKKNK